MKAFSLALVAVLAFCLNATAGQKFYLVNGKVEAVEDTAVAPEPATTPNAAEAAPTPAVRYVQVCDGRTCRMVAVPAEPVSTSAPVAAPAKAMAADCPCVASSGSCPCGGTASASSPVLFPRIHNAVESFRSNRPILFPRLHALINR